MSDTPPQETCSDTDLNTSCDTGDFHIEVVVDYTAMNSNAGKAERTRAFRQQIRNVIAGYDIPKTIQRPQGLVGDKLEWTITAIMSMDGVRALVQDELDSKNPTIRLQLGVPIHLGCVPDHERCCWRSDALFPLSTIDLACASQIWRRGTINTSDAILIAKELCGDLKDCPPLDGAIKTELENLPIRLRVHT